LSVHRRNIFWSVGSIERTPGLLKTLRKEGFARVHRPRKGYSLMLLEGIRDKLPKHLVECKDCAKDKIISSYKLWRKGFKFPGGHQKVHGRTQKK
jgi:hypothetical protein